ncbi:hypothetical protein O6H91_04G043400 [Diphasiastrum complanatum]|uniref:Uncharacterized protein n=1 Tax=Diphasiastrum complanatum TaxID=34168 RepID=A0ACC2DW88_DIPCM|nr:hypothetical protein O6H91_04G043400 [Diphasiastrum complanatum]
MFVLRIEEAEGNSRNGLVIKDDDGGGGGGNALVALKGDSEGVGVGGKRERELVGREEERGDSREGICGRLNNANGIRHWGSFCLLRGLCQPFHELCLAAAI